MATFTLKNKTITIPQELVDFGKSKLYIFDEADLMEWLRTPLTKGDFKNGFKHPDLDKYIQDHSDKELSEIICMSLENEKKVFSD